MGDTSSVTTRRRGRPSNTSRQAETAARARTLADDLARARREPWIYLGDQNYRDLVRQNRASDALANAASVLVGPDMLIAALAATVQHARHYQETMTERRRRAAQDIVDAQTMLAAAWSELRNAEGEEGAFPAPVPAEPR